MMVAVVTIWRAVSGSTQGQSNAGPAVGTVESHQGVLLGATGPGRLGLLPRFVVLLRAARFGYDAIRHGLRQTRAKPPPYKGRASTGSSPGW
jgi:hypothetical protein